MLGVKSGTLEQGCQLIFTGGHVSHAVAFDVILGLYKCNYFLSESSALLPGRKKVPGWIKQGGGLDPALGPCVCHLCTRDWVQIPAPSLISSTDIPQRHYRFWSRPLQ